MTQFRVVGVWQSLSCRINYTLINELTEQLFLWCPGGHCHYIEPFQWGGGSLGGAGWRSGCIDSPICRSRVQVHVTGWVQLVVSLGKTFSSHCPAVI